jgi:hypothetical protein
MAIDFQASQTTSRRHGCSHTCMRFLSAAERSTLHVDTAIERYVRDFKPVGWSLGMVSEATVLLYTYAQLEGHELLHSTRYTRARSRVSYNALCSFYEHGEGASRDGGGVAPLSFYIGKVNYFVKVVPADAMGIHGICIHGQYRY